ncbi:MAG: dihydroneopterin aldolase [Bacteroidales bacterium]|nr:dihydroneopterin aldolase [Bacteroidales bacterium]
MGLIQIEGMEFYAYHGHFAEERVVGNDFIIDITIETSLEAAAASDDIADAVNYQEIYNLIKEEMKVKSALLENIADRIINAIYIEFPDQIRFVKVKVSKMNPPLNGKIRNVSITMSR